MPECRVRSDERLDSATLPGSALESLDCELETIAEIVAFPQGGGGEVSVERRIRLARLEQRAREGTKRLLGKR